MNDNFQHDTAIDNAVGSLLETFGSSLPDLQAIAVFLPENSLGIDFRQQLLGKLPRNKKAVLPPWTGTLRDWVHQCTLADDTRYTTISNHTRQIMLIDALEQYPALFKKENKWQVALALLKLFDEINLTQTSILESPEDWLRCVQQAYKINSPHAQLQQEATIIHTLWHAWNTQLLENNMLDASSAYVNQLSKLASQPDKFIPDNFYCYALATDYMYPCEIDFIRAIEKIHRCTVIETDNKYEPTNVEKFINQAFAYDEASLKERAEKYKVKNQVNDPPFSVYLAHDSENEARIVDLQVRQWLIDGKKQIGIISEDRKLSRRIRALLERANVPLQDLAGWSLSTTSAAAVLERWLECIEEDFDQRPMLDLLKSHFFSTGTGREEHLENVYRLERDIIQHENIDKGLLRYKNHLKYRLKRLSHWPDRTYQNVLDLLDDLYKFSKPLVELYRAKKTYPLENFVSTLIESLDAIGIYHSYQKDTAGQQILQSLNQMLGSLELTNPRLGWSDFRTWLGITLEAQLFNPQVTPSPVKLMTLEQSNLKSFDALIFAAADSQHLPGKPDESPFFNQSARKTLGLEPWETKRKKRLQLFKQALNSAPEILITCQSENKGEPVPLSPWVDSLINFYSLSHDKSILNTSISYSLDSNPEVFISDSHEVPSKPEQPAPVVPASMIPSRMSAGAHQRLIDCPYKFFSGDILKLKATDDISAELQKSDYGERIHLILQAFHQQTGDFPPPFSKSIDENSREQAINHLEELSQKIFKRDLEDNVLHRSWLHRWRAHIPAYIDWQISQQKTWQVMATEQKRELQITEKTQVYGRLDRIDSNGNKHAIIDYKTGYSAKQADIDSGEDIQLTTYAMLDDDCEQVFYLSLDEKDGVVRSRASLSNETLETLKTRSLERLKILIAMIEKKHALHAWGDNASCQHCNFSGLCRRQAWK